MSPEEWHDEWDKIWEMEERSQWRRFAMNENFDIFVKTNIIHTFYFIASLLPTTIYIYATILLLKH